MDALFGSGRNERESGMLARITSNRMCPLPDIPNASMNTGSGASKVPSFTEYLLRPSNAPPTFLSIATATTHVESTSFRKGDQPPPAKIWSPWKSVDEAPKESRRSTDTSITTIYDRAMRNLIDMRSVMDVTPRFYPETWRYIDRPYQQHQNGLYDLPPFVAPDGTRIASSDPRAPFSWSGSESGMMCVPPSPVNAIPWRTLPPVSFPFSPTISKGEGPVSMATTSGVIRAAASNTVAASVNQHGLPSKPIASAKPSQPKAAPSSHSVNVKSRNSARASTSRSAAAAVCLEPHPPEMGVKRERTGSVVPNMVSRRVNPYQLRLRRTKAELREDDATSAVAAASNPSRPPVFRFQPATQKESFFFELGLVPRRILELYNNS